MDAPNAHDRVGTAIRRRRKLLRLTQIQAAELSGVGVVFLRAAERGKPTLRFDHLVRLLDTLGLKLELRDAGGPSDGLTVSDAL